MQSAMSLSRNTSCIKWVCTIERLSHSLSTTSSTNITTPRLPMPLTSLCPSGKQSEAARHPPTIAPSAGTTRAGRSGSYAEAEDQPRLYAAADTRLHVPLLAR
ncbi:unnamed protein product [Lota lota]